jgi:glycosyltransferase involved in cell wall biosynthesis
MRLTIVTPFPPAITGIGRYGYHVSHLLNRSGAFSQVTVLTGHNGHLQMDTSPAIEVRQGWQPDGWRTGGNIPANLLHTQPDLVWFNLGVSVFGRNPLANLSGFLSVLRIKRSGIPTVVTLHELAELTNLRELRAPGGPLSAYGARLLTYIATRGDVTCLTTRQYTNWLAARHSDGQFIHIPLGAYEKPDPLPEEDAPELLLFTTLAPFKGVELLVQAFQELKKSQPDMRLTIAGAEHVRFPGYIDKVQRAYRHVEGVRWLGQVRETEIRDLFQRAQLVILPYLASTGSSSVLWQAAMYGRVIIASDLDEIHSVVDEAGLEVMFFERRNVHNLVKTIHRMLTSPNLRRTQVQANLEASQRHRPQDTCQAYLRAFNLALEANRSSRRIPLKTPPEKAF